MAGVNSSYIGLGLIILSALLIVVRAAPEEITIGGTTSFLKNVLSPAFMTPTCFDDFINFPPSSACIASTISKLLGVGIIAGSFALKLPQILGILKAQSAEGMILSALYLETSSVASTSLYNIAVGTPLSTYAESLVIFVQNVILIILCWHFLKVDMKTRLMTTVCAAIYIASHFAVPPAFLPLLMILATVTSMSGRVQQVIGNFKAKSTGVLSLTTTIMQVGGTAARVFTTLQEVDDIAILASFVIAFLLNLTILIQIFAYWGDKKSISAALKESSKELAAEVTNSVQKKADVAKVTDEIRKKME